MAFVADLDRPVLEEDDRRHLSGSLRLRAGAELTVSDGSGGWRVCRLGDDLEPVGEIHRSKPPRPPVTVGFALVKGGKVDAIVQRLTEVGVDRIVPFHAARSVIRWDDATALGRWLRMTRVMKEAAMQSRRVWLPQVEAVRPFDQVAGPATILADPDGDPLTEDLTEVMVGPEGGWTVAERGDRRTLRLGTEVMRAETAAVVAGALLVGLRARLLSAP